MSTAAVRPRRLIDWLRWSPTAALNAFKTALGLVIAWALVLWLQWPDAFLAPMAVLFLQTPYLGASLRKGLMRVFGTLAGGLAVLLLLGWLIEDRWALLAALSLLIGFAIYQIRASRYGYAWYMVAITATVIVADAVPQPQLALQLAVYRTSEAVLGILIVLVINGLFWPQTAGRVYRRELSTTLDQLADYARALAIALREPHPGALPRPSRAIFGASVRLREILTAAVLDSSGFRRLRETYEAEIRGLTAVTGALLALAESLRLALDGELPLLAAARRAPLARTLDELAALLAACRPQSASIDAAGEQDDADRRRLPTQVAARIAARLEALWSRTTASADSHAADARGDALRLAVLHQCRALVAEAAQLARAAEALATGRALPAGERPAAPARAPWRNLKAGLPAGLSHALAAVIAFWVVLLLWFQWQWPPAGFIGALMAVIIIGIDTLNDLPAEHPGQRVFIGALAGCVLTAPVYLLVMPRLDGFVELALVLFPFYYAGLYLFHAHAKPHNLYFLGLLVMGILMPALAPEQQISLIGYLNAALSVLSGFLLGLLVLGLLVGQRPHQVFKRGLRDLLLGIARSQRALAYRSRPDFARLVQASEDAQRAQLQRLARIAPLAGDPAAPQNDQARIDALLVAAQSLSIRARALQRARLHAGSPGRLQGGRRLPLGRRYRRVFGVLLRQLAARLEQPGVEVRVDALDRLRAWAVPELARLAARDGARMDDPQERAARTYLLAIVGHYIGVARALREFNAAVDAIDWAAWRQPRF
jgi:uncharacterized membrane protein YccC